MIVREPMRLARALRAPRMLTAAALGLPSALLAHAMVFGSDHAAAGAMHTAALAGACFMFFAVAALCAQRVATQGSVIGARLRAVLPSIPSIAASASLWFALMESLEAAHAPALLLSIAALVLAAAIVQLAARCIGTLIGDAVLALIAFCVTAERALGHALQAPVVLVAVSSAHTGRRFSRPPPALS